MAKLTVFLIVLLVMSALLSSPVLISDSSQLINNANIILEIEVRKGWSLADIIKGIGMTRANLFKLNRLASGGAVEPGEKLLVAPYHAFSRVQVSWYGPKFHGKTMANGKPFDMYDPTVVAHKWLPFGTVVKLTCGSSNSVRVTVKDRGPYIEGRHFDLSFGAAERLEIIKQGVAHCKVNVLS